MMVKYEIPLDKFDLKVGQKVKINLKFAGSREDV